MTRILIAGAGIGGLTAAFALARAGCAVTLLERAATFAAVGAGVQVSPNAGRVLQRLGLLEAVRAVSVAPRAIRVRAARSGATLSLLPLADAEARWGAPYLVAHRADLQGVLVDAVAREPAIIVHRGTTLAGFGTAPDGVVAAARQGAVTRSFEAEVLIGADGVRSAVRARLVAGGADAPAETGRVAWRTLVPAEACDAMLTAGETGLWLGRDAHLVHYPTREGALINVVAVLAGDPLPAQDDNLWTRRGDPAVIAQRFARWHRAPRALVAAASSWQCWPLFDRAPLPAWSAGSVALLGDAAHPVLPFLAQGAAQAIEDADALAGALGQDGPIADRLAAYGATRQPRATRVQVEARRLGKIYHLGGPAKLARDMAMRALGPKALLARYDWLYGGGPAALRR